MHGRRIGVLEVDRTAAVQPDAPPSVVLELDAVPFDVDHPHAVAVRDVQGRIVAGDPRPIARRQLAAGRW